MRNAVRAMWLSALCFCLLVTLVCSASVSADPIVFTSDTQIGGSDATYEGLDIVVHGCTLTIDGSHSFHCLTIERGDTNIPGILTHNPGVVNGSVKGCALTIETDLTVQGADGALVASRIDASGRGYGSEQGPGKGAHGTIFGPGGAYGGGGGDVFNATGGLPYIVFPEFGSGGGGGGTGPGGSGGGCIQLTIGGSLMLDGVILADGSDGPIDGGAGAGGAISISANVIAGAGAISANGGSASSSYSGGGGGGRISLVYGTSTFSGTTTAYGGYGNINGGAGTITLSCTTPSIRTCTIDNGGYAGALSSCTPASQTDLVIIGGASAYLPATTNYAANLHIGAGSQLTHQAASTSGLNLTVSGDAVIDPGGSIIANGKGYPSEQGTGKGSRYFPSSGYICGTGGGHGGSGGSVSTAAGGITYDTTIAPSSIGSGGGSGTGASGFTPGGSGGGRISLTVSGNLTVNGSISANGDDAQFFAGGGSGGSVNVNCSGTLFGTGAISANGGAASTSSGGGGGGLVAASYGVNTFTGAITAYGGVAGSTGGAGTIYLVSKLQGSHGSILIDNGGNPGAQSQFTSGSSEDVTISGGAAAFSRYANVGPLHVCAGGTLLQLQTTNFQVSGNVTIDAGGCISADGRYMTALQTRGLGGSGSAGGGGGGYGGNGGNGLNAVGGVGYDSPVIYSNSGRRGSDGGYGGSPTANPGGTGAGALRLTVSGILTNNGSISANGADGTGTGGGGSGGTVCISAPTVTGSGVISANGGNGLTCCAGGGGGGRIMVWCTNNTFTGTTSAVGGTGYQNGGAGSTCWAVRVGNYTDFAVLVDNGGRAGAASPMSAGQVHFSLTVTGRANVCITSFELQSLHLTAGTQLTLTTAAQLTNPDLPKGLYLRIISDATIDAGCAISADGMGYGSGAGTGQGGGSSTYGAGGGYGGKGGDSTSGALGGSTYGSDTSPMDLGSGGGAGGSYPGGLGGGRLQLAVRGVLTVNGSISADGGQGYYTAGGGSGGTVLIGAQTLAGSGTISANGGAASSLNAGGGGGGRVAVYYVNSSGFEGSHVSANGGAGGHNGAVGTALYSKLEAPTISSTPNDYAVNGMPYVGPTLTATNAVTVPDFTSLSWSLVSGPVGMSVGYATGVVSWPNPTKDGSPYSVTIRAANHAGSGTITWSTSVVDNPKLIPDGGALGIDSPQVTGVFGDDVYMQPANRLWGLKVRIPGNQLYAGPLLRLRGTLATGPNTERYIDAQSSSYAGESSASAISMPFKCLGGGNWHYDSSTGAGQKGVTGGNGLNNLGLLVRVCGWIEQIVSNGEENWFVLNDGGWRQVKVTVPMAVSIDPDWHFVIVTGISSCELVDGEVKSIILTRTAEDIAPME